jgi:hypothetical protein
VLLELRLDLCDLLGDPRPGLPLPRAQGHAGVMQQQLCHFEKEFEASYAYLPVIQSHIPDYGTLSSLRGHSASSSGSSSAARFKCGVMISTHGVTSPRHSRHSATHRTLRSLRAIFCARVNLLYLLY